MRAYLPECVDVGLSVDVRVRSDAEVVISLRGEIDCATIERVRAAVDEALRARPYQLCIDMGLVTFVDSTGVGVLVSGHRSAQAVGCRLTMAHLAPFVHRTLHLMGLLDLFGVP